jgi:hypothetical protein
MRPNENSTLPFRRDHKIETYQLLTFEPPKTSVHLEGEVCNETLVHFFEKIWPMPSGISLFQHTKNIKSILHKTVAIV